MFIVMIIVVEDLVAATISVNHMNKGRWVLKISWPVLCKSRNSQGYRSSSPRRNSDVSSQTGTDKTLGFHHNLASTKHGCFVAYGLQRNIGISSRIVVHVSWFSA
ncbi:hypothetical protein Hanom_Chr16g01464741 [Helianthus anomalus]